MKAKKQEIDDGKACAILAYFFPIGLIWYLVDENMKKNKFAQFHVYQGLVLAITAIILSIVAVILTAISLGFLFFIAWIVNIAMLVLFIIGIINSAQGEEKPLPVIGHHAKKFKF
ncbi:MAG: DUF4870 domain-containing protein [Nanobdellota archaeon]